MPALHILKKNLINAHDLEMHSRAFLSIGCEFTSIDEHLNERVMRKVMAPSSVCIYSLDW